METDNALCFADSTEWRRWLEQNHDREKAVWLIIYKNNSVKHSLNYADALEVALCFGWIDGKMKSLDAEKYALRYSPRTAGSIWSRINREKAEKLIAQGKMTAAGLKTIAEAKKRGLWDGAYTNRHRWEMPADLEQALSVNKDARDNFQQFANSYRNMYIYWVNSAKTTATRQKRLLKVVERSALNKKPGTDM
jgi:uncharacterized protein YdeI (YjbR/CyaY-like superfamily)